MEVQIRLCGICDPTTTRQRRVVPLPSYDASRRRGEENAHSVGSGDGQAGRLRRVDCYRREDRYGGGFKIYIIDIGRSTDD